MRRTDRKAIRIRILVLLCFFLSCLLTPAAAEWQRFRFEGTGEANSPAMDYWVYVPEGAAEGLPLIVFLHGSGEKGDGALEQSLPRYIRDGTVPAPDSILVVPQLPENLRYWAAAENAVLRITDEAAAAFGADPSRLSLAGFSLGGMGVWNLAKTAPGKFTRVLCVCGKISTYVNPELFAGCSLRLCTGSRDKSVDAKALRRYAANARKAGIDAEWIEYPSNHLRTSELVFTDPDMLAWLRLHNQKEDMQKEEAP